MFFLGWRTLECRQIFGEWATEQRSAQMEWPDLSCLWKIRNPSIPINKFVVDRVSKKMQLINKRNNPVAERFT